MGWILPLVVLGVLHVYLSPGLSQPSFHHSPHLLWIAYLYFPLIFCAWSWSGFLWGAGALVWSAGVVTFVALVSRHFFLLWLPLEYLLFGCLVHWGLTRWQQLLRMTSVRYEKIEEKKNSLEVEIERCGQMLVILQTRLQRYQQLRTIANSFSASLSMENLLQAVVRCTGEVMEMVDLALLFLVDPKSLLLELKSVWRRLSGAVIKTKTGDPFDLWVMRQGQPLLVQEPGNDFRFPQMSEEELGRGVGALVAVPLSSEYRTLGVLRAESIRPRGLMPDDLRLMKIIGDLGSLAVENSRLYTRMAELAITDDLTGLSVRRYFQKRLGEEISRGKGFGAPLSLLLIDIDRFKVYNDTFGHTAGDKLLKHLASLLGRFRQPGEVAARFGGEEFVLLLPGVSQEEAANRAEALRAEVEAAQVELRRILTQTTVSIGVATFPQDDLSVEGLIQKADERLYKAKALGRNRVCQT